MLPTFVSVRLNSPQKTQFIIIHVIVAIITLACIAMNDAMRGGLPIDTTLAERGAFILANQTIWTALWCIWMCAALGLLTFCAILAQRLNASVWRNIGLIIVAIGIAPDLIAEVIYAFIIPQALTLQNGLEVFSLLEISAQFLTGFLGNGLYNIGGLILTVLAIKQKLLKPWIAVWGVSAWILGLLLSVSVAVGSMEMAEVFTASSMVLSTLWMLVFAYFVLTPPARA